MNDADLKQLRDVIRAEFATQTKHMCRIPITDDQAHQIGEFVQELSEVGGHGSLRAAFREAQANHAWLTLQRSRGDALSKTLYYPICVGIVSGLAAALWKGLKLLVREG